MASASGIAPVWLVRWLRMRGSVDRRLRAALKLNGLKVHYQPIVDSQTARIVGAEALMRWQQVDGSHVAPNTFIPVAEDIGVIRHITEIAIRAISQDFAIWLKQAPEFTLSLNVLADDLTDPFFHECLKSAIEDNGINPAQIAFELTERRKISRLKGGRATNSLSSRGYKIYLDDFGTGYSNIDYFGRLTLDKIKLDRTFIMSIGRDERRSSLIPLMVEMAKRYGIGIIAEGVETAEQAEFLRALGVDQMQGWHFGRAMTAQALLEHLRSDCVESV
ncbi:EAL domain-containing protein [Aureimonas fodinaquatilis]|uniref:EAL domain-containing protein n=1 Tax=Aureimonas fodinaquatilis TaxID=2565783 RepID=UPI001AEE3CE3|nr:EAL domain-containing protein [Aureimonas fodinaquatilis]